MGNVTVVTKGGKVVTLDEKDAALLVKSGDAREQTDQEYFKAGEEAVSKENTSGFAQQGKTILEGVAEGLSGGAFGKIAGAISPEYGKRLAERGRNNPGERLIGEVGSLLLPVGAGAAAAKAGRAVESATGRRVLGLATEGAILGGTAQVSASTISGDPLTVEGMVEGMGVAGLLTAGIGAAAERLATLGGKKAAAADSPLNWRESTTPGKALNSKATKARAAADKAKTASEEAYALEELAKTKRVYDESPAYNNLRDKYNEHKKLIESNDRAVQKEVAEFADWATADGVNKTIRQYEKAQAEIRSRAQKAARGGTEQADGDLARLGVLSESLDDISRLKNSVGKALKEDEFELIHAAMNSVNEKLAKSLPDIALPSIPKYPGQLSGKTLPTMPKTLTELGKLRGDSAARLTAELKEAGLDDAVALLGQELGLADDVIGGASATMRKQFYTKKAKAELSDLDEDVLRFNQRMDSQAEWNATRAGAAEELAGSGRQIFEGNIDELFDGLPGVALAKSTRGGPRNQVLNWARSGVLSAAGRLADTGGWRGAIMRRMAWGAMGYSLDGVEGAILGGAAVGARGGLIGNIRSMVSNAGRLAAKGMTAVRPIAAYASTRFPDGDPDPEPDIGKATVNRINEIYAATQTAPDQVYELVKGLMGQPGDLAAKIHQKIMLGLEYLAQTAPKDPGIDVTLRGSDWAPDMFEADTWLHRYEAVLNPMGYMRRVFSGDGKPEGVEALAINWPAMLTEAQMEAATQNWEDLTLEQHEGLSLLFQRPLSAMQHPTVGLLIQGQYQKQMMAYAQQSQQGPAPTGGPVGRPAAVQSQVAGSNVGQHIS